MKHIPVVDGLRAIAVSLVLINHAWRKGPVIGGFGVTLFFFISGFLITGLLVDELRRTGRINFAAFYWRRFRRLAPALLVMLAVCTAVYWWWFGIWAGQEAMAGVLYIFNYYAITHSQPGQDLTFITLWTLAVEEHFYLVFPLVVALGWRFGRGLVAALFMICVLVLLWRCCLVGQGERIYMSTDTRIDSILYGCILAIAIRLKIYLEWLKEWWVLALAAITLAFGTLLPDQSFAETFRYTDQGLAFIPLFYWLVYGPSNWATRVLESAPVVWIGKLSYSLYLWHFPILDMCHRLPLPRITQVLLGLALSLVLSVLSYYCVEKPLRYAAKRPTTSSMASELGR